MGCCYAVPNDELYVLEKCGKFDSVAQPGFLCLPVPCVCTVAAKLSTRILKFVQTVETKTKDNVFVKVCITVQYAIQLDKIYEANYRLADPDSQIKNYIFDVVRSTIPMQTLDEVFESKDEIAFAVKNELTSVMSDFGFHIVRTLVTEIIPDSQVRDAMNEINASKRDRLAAIEKAEAEKVSIVKAAEASAESMFLQGQGVARQRKAIVNGLKDSVMNFSEAITDIDSHEVLDLVLLTQYFDTLKEISSKRSGQTLFIPHNPGSLSALAEEISTGIITVNAPKHD